MFNPRDGGGFGAQRGGFCFPPNLLGSGRSPMLRVRHTLALIDQFVKPFDLNKKRMAQSRMRGHSAAANYSAHFRTAATKSGDAKQTINDTQFATFSK